MFYAYIMKFCRNKMKIKEIEARWRFGMHFCQACMWDNTAFWLVARFNPLKIFQLFIIRPATSPDQSEPKISTDGACADFVLFLSGPIRCLFSGVEISLNRLCNCWQRPHNKCRNEKFLNIERNIEMHALSTAIHGENNE
jgi:hypothetical protein